MYLYRIFCRIIYLFVFIFVSCSEVLINDFEVSGVSYDMEKIVVNFTSNIEGEKVKDSFQWIHKKRVNCSIRQYVIASNAKALSRIILTILIYTMT